MAFLAYPRLWRGHDRAAIATTDVQVAPRCARRAVATYAGLAAALLIAYLAV